MLEKVACMLPVVTLAALGACGPAGDEIDDGGDVDAGFEDISEDGTDIDGDGVIDSEDNCPELANPDQMNFDGDVLGDACDCEPDSRINNSVLIAEDRLDSDRGLFVPAEGFLADSWTYDGTGLTQTRLANEAADAVFLDHDRPLRDVRIELTAASTGISDFDTTDLRQNLVLARASSSAGGFSAVGCGIEVVEGLTPTQKTSILIEGGVPGDVRNTVETRVDRAAVEVNEEYKITLDLRGNTMTCTVTLGGTDVSVAESSNIGGEAGAIGLFTRESRALFHSIKICEYR